ncbi:acyltransferase [bacterium]|nr:acyltransferase [bacterium]
MQVGFVQFEPIFGEKKLNFERIKELILTRQADLWVLPELFATGYQFKSQEEMRGLAEPASGGATFQFLQQLCIDSAFHIVAGFTECDEGACYNSSMLIGPDGLVGVYRKVHLFADERQLFSPGNLGFPVFDIGSAKVGMMICFDWLFPEAARSLALGGADIIAHPVNLVLPFCQDAMKTRCLENGLFAITANRIGTEHRTESSLTFTGRSQIVDPSGKRLIRIGEKISGVQVVSIDPMRARDKMVTEHNDRLADRRPEQYR